MFKQTVAFFLLLAFVGQTFSGGFVLLDYYANTASFAKNCINKAKPVMKCNGKCQVMKKLQEAEKEDQQMPERKLEKKMEIIATNFLLPALASFPVMNTAPVAVERHYPLARFSSSFFRPPRA